MAARIPSSQSSSRCSASRAARSIRFAIASTTLIGLLRDGAAFPYRPAAVRKETFQRVDVGFQNERVGAGLTGGSFEMLPARIGDDIDVVVLRFDAADDVE